MKSMLSFYKTPTLNLLQMSHRYSQEISIMRHEARSPYFIATIQEVLKLSK